MSSSSPSLAGSERYRSLSTTIALYNHYGDRAAGIFWKKCQIAFNFWKQCVEQRYPNVLDSSTYDAQLGIVKQSFMMIVTAGLQITDEEASRKWKPFLRSARTYISIYAHQEFIEEDEYTRVISGKCSAKHIDQIIKNAKVARSEALSSSALPPSADGNGNVGDIKPAHDAAADGNDGNDGSTGGGSENNIDSAVNTIGTITKERKQQASSGYVEEQQNDAAEIGIPHGSLLLARRIEREREIDRVLSNSPHQYGSKEMQGILDAVKKIFPVERIRGGARVRGGKATKAAQAAGLPDNVDEVDSDDDIVRGGAATAAARAAGRPLNNHADADDDDDDDADDDDDDDDDIVRGGAATVAARAAGRPLNNHADADDDDDDDADDDDDDDIVRGGAATVAARAAGRPLNNRDDDDDGANAGADADVDSNLTASQVVHAAAMVGAVENAANFVASTSNLGLYREECNIFQESNRRSQDNGNTSVQRTRGGGYEDYDSNGILDKNGKKGEDVVSSKKRFFVKGELQAGSTVQRIGASGFTAPCNINNGVGVYNMEEFCRSIERRKRHGIRPFLKYNLYHLGRDIFQLANVGKHMGDGKYLVVHTAEMGEGDYIEEHQDKKDICPQLICTLGDYEGGMLQVKVNGAW
eukprot:CAMPEP_0178715492 /NCGR_PEP_ID=MMETSP0699-20121125/20701_1 /TAXON_ID=265572 /ORGANISM="Extubocellulus spinifer, Strain CCMP396" /LENGTH=640 /DNA_ID=CAMNT_0020364827 /DNA_START=206 /DNA_END=2125 /DNA_ORIENTATION=+